MRNISEVTRAPAHPKVDEAMRRGLTLNLLRRPALPTMEQPAFAYLTASMLSSQVHITYLLFCIEFNWRLL